MEANKELQEKSPAENTSVADQTEEQKQKDYKKDTQSRKWLITINNPLEHGYTRSYIKEILASYKSIVYWCMSDETAESGTPHIHIFTAFSSGVRFGSLKKKFNEARLDMCNGTSQQNRDYVFKEGKWEENKKNETNDKESHEEWGEMPIERQGNRVDVHQLYEMITEGKTDLEILDHAPQYMFKMDKISNVRQIRKFGDFKETFREMQVTYMFGKTGTGKTRYVMEKYGYRNVYRVTDYRHPFDGYAGQNVMVFEEFNNSLRINNMLNYLDGYPQELPCRYNNKAACYTKVYIISNISLIDQYKTVQEKEMGTYEAFCRRIHRYVEYKENGEEEYFNNIKQKDNGEQASEQVVEQISLEGMES